MKPTKLKKWIYTTLVLLCLIGLSNIALRFYIPDMFGGPPGRPTLRPVGKSSSKPNFYIRGGEYEGVIFTNTFYASIGLDKQTPYWIPSVGNIQNFEKGLRAEMEKFSSGKKLAVPLSKYKRQYFGILKKGHKVIFVNLFCGDESYWKEKAVWVMDGGNCYMQIKYDVQTGSYFDYMENGFA